MPQREPSADIDAVAADWAARADRAPLSSEEAEALQRWLDGDARRVGAYAKARAVLVRLDRARALGASYAPEVFAQASPSAPRRRAVLAAGGAAAIAATVGAAAALLGRSQDFRTRRGEVRLVPLPDGSVVTLNTGTHLRVRFDQGRRSLALLNGEALFEVAKDRARPFVVQAAGARVRAVGTSFTVRRRADAGVQVLVAEGLVEVSCAGQGGRPPLRVAANKELLVDEARLLRPVSVAPAQIARRLAWREGMLDFEGVSLQSAAEEFSRYSDTRLVIEDPSVAGLTITGRFSANDPRGFAEAAALSLGLRAQGEADSIRLSR